MTFDGAIFVFRVGFAFASGRPRPIAVSAVAPENSIAYGRPPLKTMSAGAVTSSLARGRPLLNKDEPVGELCRKVSGI